MVYVEKDLIFYDIMKYPIPTQSDFFVYWKKLHTEWNFDKTKYTRKERNQYMDTFINEINKHWKLYKSLPFVSEIFLCNSITFNALKEDSDIDIFIIAKNDAMRRARFFSALFFKILWLKRSLKNKKLKYCLSFYVTEDNKNLYPIILPNKTDIYLAYRLGHLVPLYHETEKCKNIYKDNPRFSSYLPNHIQDYCINIWNDNFCWASKIKKFFEFICGWFIWKLIENFIKLIWLPILKNKVKKLWDKWKQIVISDKILKFHDDIRSVISDLHSNYIH
jgi:hypothetical protein